MENQLVPSLREIGVFRKNSAFQVGENQGGILPKRTYAVKELVIALFLAIGVNIAAQHHIPGEGQADLICFEGIGIHSSARQGAILKLRADNQDGKDQNDSNAQAQDARIQATHAVAAGEDLNSLRNTQMLRAIIHLTCQRQMAVGTTVARIRFFFKLSHLRHLRSPSGCPGR